MASRCLREVFPSTRVLIHVYREENACGKYVVVLHRLAEMTGFAAVVCHIVKSALVWDGMHSRKNAQRSCSTVVFTVRFPSVLYCFPPVGCWILGGLRLPGLAGFKRTLSGCVVCFSPMTRYDKNAGLMGSYVGLCRLKAKLHSSSWEHV